MSLARHQPAVPLAEPGPSTYDYTCAWRMRDEFSFLRGLGHWRTPESAEGRAQLLRGYLAGLALRRRWAGLEREPLECEAREELRRAEGAAA